MPARLVDHKSRVEGTGSGRLRRSARGRPSQRRLILSTACLLTPCAMPARPWAPPAARSLWACR